MARSNLTVLAIFFMMMTIAQSRVDVAAPVRPGEKSSRDWEKLAQAQEEEDAERAKVLEMGGSDTALVNVLDGDIDGGVIHPVGDRTKGIATANFSQVASEFLGKIDRQHDALAHEKIVYWLNQGAGFQCDSCKYMLEEAHRRVLMIANEKIRERQTTGANFKGGAGHQIKMDDAMKTEIANVCLTSQYANANHDSRRFCELAMTGRHKSAILSTFTQGSFGYEDLLSRQATVCGDPIMKVCPAKPVIGAGISDCRACAEAFQDFDRYLQNDRRDIDVGSLGVKSHKASSEQDKKFRGKHHVWQKAQDLCSQTAQRHPPKAASVIQEQCEEILEEYESHVVRAFVDASSKHPGAGAEEVCVDVAEKCTSEEFNAIQTNLASWHLRKYPLTQQLHEAAHTEL